MYLRLLQHSATDGARAVIAARGDEAWLVPGATSIRALAEQAIAAGSTLAEVVDGSGRGDAVDIAAGSRAHHCPDRPILRICR